MARGDPNETKRAKKPRKKAPKIRVPDILRIAKIRLEKNPEVRKAQRQTEEYALNGVRATNLRFAASRVCVRRASEQIYPSMMRLYADAVTQMEMGALLLATNARRRTIEPEDVAAYARIAYGLDVIGHPVRQPTKRRNTEEPTQPTPST